MDADCMVCYVCLTVVCVWLLCVWFYIIWLKHTPRLIFHSLFFNTVIIAAENLALDFTLKVSKSGDG